MRTSEHIRWELLLDFVENGSPLPETAERHLAGCGSCIELRREAENLLGAFEIVSSPAPSEALISAAMGQIRQEFLAKGATPVDRLKGAWKEIWATLALGSLAPSHAVRGASSATPVMMVYEAGDFVISISLKDTTPTTRNVLGKVVPRSVSEIPAGEAVLIVGDSTQSAGIDALGNFRFDGVPMKAFRIDVTLGEATIHLPQVGDSGADG